MIILDFVSTMLRSNLNKVHTETKCQNLTLKKSFKKKIIYIYKKFEINVGSCKIIILKHFLTKSHNTEVRSGVTFFYHC